MPGLLPTTPAAPYSDRCKRCCTQTSVPPFATEESHGETWAAYACPRCGHGWITRWLLEAGSVA
jgi:hypothetical protein